MRTVLCRTALFLAVSALTFAQTTFSNNSPISSTGTLGTTLYPSSITVSGLSGTISNVNVRIKGFTHQFPNGLDILLVGPANQKFIVMSDSGRVVAVSNITFTLSDSGATRLPNLTDGTPGPILNNTTYRPTDAESGDTFPSPAPTGPYQTPAPVGSATFASVFNGANANGTWSLYVSSDTAGDVWTIATGWDLIVTVAADLSTSTVLTSSQNPSFTSAPNNNTTFTATVSSGGSPVTVGSVTFRSNGTIIGGPTTVNASGVATLTTSFATEGVKTITATYNPGAGFATSSGSLSQTVNNQTTVSGNTFCNAGPNSLSGAGGAAVYPQRVFTAGLGGSISGVSLQLNGLTHNAGNGLDVMLVAPNGAAFVPMSDTGGALSASNINLTLTDTAGASLPQSGALSSGSFKPANYAPVSDSDLFPAPAPASPLNAAPTGAATFASAFAGGTPNGTWQLFLSNDTGGDSGSTASYCITVATTSDPGTTTTLTSSANPSILTNSVTFTATVRRSDNNALVTNGTVTFSENANVLAGPVALNGSGQAAFSTTSLNEGAHTITATYSGVPGAFNTSFGTATQQVDNATIQTLNSFCNNGTTTVPANGLAQPYGQRILVSGLAGAVSNLTVSVNGLTNATPDDWDFLLVSPTGQKYVLMGDAGGVNSISGVNIVLSDTGATLPNSTLLTSGTYQPAVYEGATFPAPAPATPYTFPPATLASTFGGFDPNGYWSLFVADDVPGASSTIGGYCLNFAVTPPDLTITKSHAGNFKQGQAAATYTIRVTNNGPGSTQGTVTVDDTLPSGLTATNLQGTGWTCTLSPLRCTRNDALNAGNSYPDITLTVNVSGTAASTVTNSATVSGGGDSTSGNNTASDLTTIVQVSDLTITKTHAGNFTQGQQGTYTITVQNSGAGPTEGTVTVADNLPAGLTLASLSGTGWTCSLATASCTRSDALAASSSYPAITAVVNVSANAPASVVNQAVVTGGGELNNSNNIANDTTSIAAGTFNVSVTTNIPGLTFTVDSTSYTSLQTFAWTPSSSHTIATTSPQGAGGTRYVFQNWSDGGAISHTVSPAVATSYVANFATEYQLTAVANPAGSGSVTPSGFFAAGSNVTLSATAAACNVFGSWSANAPGGVVNMSGPQTVTATFLPFIAANVSAGVQVTRGGFRFDRATGRFVQQVDLTNNTGAALSGVALAIDALTSGVSLANGSGVTACSAPSGSAYANFGSLAPGASATLFLQFNNPARVAISYAPRVLAGPGQP